MHQASKVRFEFNRMSTELMAEIEACYYWIFE